MNHVPNPLMAIVLSKQSFAEYHAGDIVTALLERANCQHLPIEKGPIIDDFVVAQGERLGKVLSVLCKIAKAELVIQATYKMDDPHSVRFVYGFVYLEPQAKAKSKPPTKKALAVKIGAESTQGTAVDSDKLTQAAKRAAARSRPKVKYSSVAEVTQSN